jgi:flavodoxin
MQTLVVYYSRGGNTKKVAEELSKELKCDIEEIQDTVNRSGPIGWLNSGRQASTKALTKLQPIKNDPAKYDLVIIGTPVWASHVSTPVRTYITENKDKLKKVAFLVTEGNGGDVGAVKDMEEISGKTSASTLVVKVPQIKKGEYQTKVKQFADTIKA